MPLGTKPTGEVKGDVGDAVDDDRGEEAFGFETEPAAGDAADRSLATSEEVT